MTAISRTRQFVERFDLAGKTVLDVGCNEGQHAKLLTGLGATVMGVDARKSHVESAKKAVPDAVFIVADLEHWTFPFVDACWHSGLLYHLFEPEHHARRCWPQVRKCMYLSTHYSPRNGNVTRLESPREPRAGVRPYSTWLTRTRLLELCEDHFPHVEVLDDRIERHGPRIELYAWK